MLYATSLRHRVSAKSIKVYLTGIQFSTRILGCSISISDMDGLCYTLKGIKRIQGNSFGRPPRAPFTIQLIHSLLHHLKGKHSWRDFIMLKTAVLLAFFGLLRASEYLSSHKHHHDPSITLLVGDVRVHQNSSHIILTIKKSKTDPFRKGCAIKIWANHTTLCPVQALLGLLALHPGQGPLFMFADGSYLTRRSLSDIIKKHFGTTNLNTHSFRIGGASAAHAAGVPDSTIQALGRWASDAFRAYLRLPDSTISVAQQRMIMPANGSVWQPPVAHREGQFRVLTNTQIVQHRSNGARTGNQTK